MRENRREKFPIQTPEVIEVIIEELAELDRYQQHHPELKVVWPMPKTKLQSLFPQFKDDFIRYCHDKNFIRSHIMPQRGGRKTEGFQLIDAIKLAMLLPYNKGRDTGLKDNNLRQALSEVRRQFHFAQAEFVRRKASGWYVK